MSDGHSAVEADGPGESPLPAGYGPLEESFPPPLPVGPVRPRRPRISRRRPAPDAPTEGTNGNGAGPPAPGDDALRPWVRRRQPAPETGTTPTPAVEAPSPVAAPAPPDRAGRPDPPAGTAGAAASRAVGRLGTETEGSAAESAAAGAPAGGLGYALGAGPPAGPEPAAPGRAGSDLGGSDVGGGAAAMGRADTDVGPVTAAPRTAPVPGSRGAGPMGRTAPVPGGPPAPVERAPGYDTRLPVRLPGPGIRYDDADIDEGPVRGRRRPRQKVRVVRGARSRRLVRRVDVWTVLKVSFVLYLLGFVVLIVSGIVMWNVASTLGYLTTIEKSVRTLFSLKTFVFHPSTTLTYYAAISGVLCVVGVVTNVLAALTYNLISDVVGGVQIVVVTEPD